LSSGQRSIELVYDTSLIPGFDDGTEVLELTADLVLDYRDREGFTSSGFYLEAFAGGAPVHEKWRYAHYGLEIAGFIDLYRKTRVLELRVALEGVEGNLDEIPFSELPRLGGPNRLRGYELERFRDERIILGSLEYHYPVHKNVSGELFVDVGRVVPSYRDLFSGDSFEEHWKVGYGGGLIVGTEEDMILRLDISYGSALMVYLSTEPLMAFQDRTAEL
jgi:outer membrane protein assembly factor BamA